MKTYEITWTPEKICNVLKQLEIYFEEHPSGEHIMQSDKAQTEGLDLLSELADIIQPQHWEYN